jgi:peptide deformylase
MSTQPQDIIIGDAPNIGQRTSGNLLPTTPQLSIVKYPNFPLLQECAVWRFDTYREPATGLTLPELVAVMFRVMYANGGVGLAANQIGVAWRIFVADPMAGTTQRGQQQIVAVNPELSELDGLQVGKEGCLSLDTRIHFPVKRSESCHLKAYDANGKLFEGDAAGFEARIFQHEVDHLDGHCCIDRTDRFSREIALKKWRKLKRK